MEERHRRNEVRIVNSKILRLSAAQDFTGLKRSTIYLRIAEGLFPPPVALGPGSNTKSAIVGWPERELAEVNEARIAGKADDEIKRLVRELVAARTKKRSR